MIGSPLFHGTQLMGFCTAYVNLRYGTQFEESSPKSIYAYILFEEQEENIKNAMLQISRQTMQDYLLQEIGK